MTELRAWYIATYKDRFFTDRQPAWFWLLTVMEAGIHVPISFTSIVPLWKGQRMSKFPLFPSRLCLLEFWCVDHDWSLVDVFGSECGGVRYLNLDRVPTIFSFGYIWFNSLQLLATTSHSFRFPHDANDNTTNAVRAIFCSAIQILSVFPSGATNFPRHPGSAVDELQ